MGVMQVPAGLAGDPGNGTEARFGMSERLYAGLLQAYPRPFRTRYRSEMIQLFSDQLRDARASGRAAGTTTTWLRTLLDLALSATGEHLRKDRTMAQSLATFEPTRTMRLLGIFGALGAVLLLVAFGTVALEAPALNQLRLIIFALGGAAIAFAFYRRQALVAPTLALLTTAGVVIAGAWYVAWLLLSANLDRPFVGTFGLIGLFASIALWVSPAIWAIGLLHTGAVWQGMTRTEALATKTGTVILLGSVVAWLGDDRLGLVDSLWGDMWQSVALAGVAMNGIGWLILAVVLVFGRGVRRAG